MRWLRFIPFLLVVLTTWLVFPAFGASGPVWMGAADGLLLAKARFFTEGLGLGSWNRYWFLGIPGNHVGSPLLPWVLSFVTGIIPVSMIDLFQVWRGMVALGVVGSVLGVWWLVRGLVSSSSKHSTSSTSDVETSFTSDVAGNAIAVFVALWTLLAPSVLVLFPQIWAVTREFGSPSWMVFSPFFLGDGERTIAFGLVLVAAGVVWRLIGRWERKRAVLLSFLVAGLVLLDSQSGLTLFLWTAAFLLMEAVAPRRGDVPIVILVGRVLVVFLLGIMLAGFWFTPGYIWTVLGSPSLGGRPFATVVITLLRQVLVFAPATLGLVAAKRWLRNVSPMTLTGLAGLLVFGSLTVAAFVADTDFWMDYSRFGRSLDLSVALVIGGLIGSHRVRSKSGAKGIAPKRIAFALIGVLALSLPFLWRRELLLRGRTALVDSAEYRVGRELERLVVEQCSTLGSEDATSDVNEIPTPASPAGGSDVAICPVRVYLSGSSAFWLNAWFAIPQVRGGGEMGSLVDWWPHGSFQIREGRDSNLAERWLDALGVSLIVVHDVGSEEVFSDFRHPGKFAQMEGWEKVWEEAGDVIYRRSSSNRVVVAPLARIVDLDILALSPPEKGDDLAGLRRYTEMLGDWAKVEWRGKREILVEAEVGEGEGIWLAAAFSPFWRVVDASVPVDVRQDPLGMIVLQPEKPGAIQATLLFDPWPDIMGGILISGLALFFILLRPEVIERLSAIGERLVGRESELDRSGL